MIDQLLLLTSPRTLLQQSRGLWTELLVDIQDRLLAAVKQPGCSCQTSRKSLFRHQHRLLEGR
jgi:hypothetical protein